VKITKTLIQIAEEGVILACDTVEHRGKLWLVPHWFVGPVEGSEQPMRIIYVHGLPMQKLDQEHQTVADRQLLIPLSRATLEGSTAQGLVVIEGPEITHYGGKNLN
jgi:hypothetical protein